MGEEVGRGANSKVHLYAFMPVPFVAGLLASMRRRILSHNGSHWIPSIAQGQWPYRISPCGVRISVDVKGGPEGWEVGKQIRPSSTYYGRNHGLFKGSVSGNDAHEISLAGSTIA
ncbi:hypothetical protein OH76DRAFT_1108676 [Lentinus brumalis]|uniref:Uncharacterized protein n=1 Tax=Lentinus brumalis TaxID=2498619 RepID=A0A371CVJ4_9APHY|nr:hypothetical protein OH76DRAFT_1108676 [Polyporus brumalis]